MVTTRTDLLSGRICGDSWRLGCQGLEMAAMAQSVHALQAQMHGATGLVGKGQAGHMVATVGAFHFLVTCQGYSVEHGQGHLPHPLQRRHGIQGSHLDQPRPFPQGKAATLDKAAVAHGMQTGLGQQYQPVQLRFVGCDGRFFHRSIPQRRAPSFLRNAWSSAAATGLPR